MFSWSPRLLLHGFGIPWEIQAWNGWPCSLPNYTGNALECCRYAHKIQPVKSKYGYDINQINFIFRTAGSSKCHRIRIFKQQSNMGTRMAI